LGEDAEGKNATMEAIQNTTSHIERMRYVGRVLVIVWAGWILAEVGIPFCVGLICGEYLGLGRVLTIAGYWLIFLIGAAIPWRWEATGGIVLLIEGAFLLICGTMDVSLLLKALPPLVAGFLFFAIWRSKASGDINRALLSTLVFRIAGHIFLLVTIFLVATKANPFYLHPFTIVPAILGYFNILCVIQSVVSTLRQGLTFPRILLAIAYSISGLAVLAIIYLISFTFTGISDYVNYAVLIVTALTGLLTAISGIIAQRTTHRKALAEIERDAALLEIEKQKLLLEYEKLQLEKERMKSSSQQVKMEKTKRKMKR
jgi:cell division protein FtsL